MKNNDMIRLAAIFNAQDKKRNITFDRLALVEYDDESGFFYVKDGKYKTTANVDYNIINCDPDIIRSINEADVKIDDYDKKKKNIYIFDEEYIKKKVLEIKHFELTYIYILIDLYTTNIHRNMLGKFKTYNRADEINHPITTLVHMLYSENYEKGNSFDLEDTKKYTNEFNELRRIKEQKYDPNLKFDHDGDVDNAFTSIISFLDSMIDSLNPNSDNDKKDTDKDKESIISLWDLSNNDKKIQTTNPDNNKNNNEYKMKFFIPFTNGYNPVLTPLKFNEYTKKYEDKEEQKKEKEYNVDIDNDIDVNEIINKISKKIIGQEDAIKTLVSNIYHNQKLIDMLLENGDYDPSELDSSKISILLDGETGTGKTAIEKEIAKELDLPIVIVNANSFSETGYVGPTITDILKKLVNKTNGNIELAERGIVVLDEIDKIRIKEGIHGKDMDEGVQDELLTFISGGEYDISVGDSFLVAKKEKFDTSKLTFILSGAFTDLREDKIKEEEKKYNGMGFSTSNNEDNNKTYTVLPEDYISSGLKREFFGRIKVLASTKSYTKENFKDILIDSIISPLRNFEKTVKMYGYPGIDFDEVFIDKIAEEAEIIKTGARGLHTIMSGIQNNLLLGLQNKEFDINEPIKLTVDLLDDYKKTYSRNY